MADKQKPYMPHVAFEIDDWRAKAIRLRREAAKLSHEADIWEEAAALLDVALGKEKVAEGKNDG